MYEQAKLAAARRAVDFIKEGQVVGLGSGSTSAYFIKALAEKKRAVRCVATSFESERLALSLGLPIISIDDCSSLDITVDGADAVDPMKRLIKGYGGALLREKIVASASQKFFVIIDRSKVVSSFDTLKLPLEVLPFGHRNTLRKLEAEGYPCSLRMQGASPFITDNGNYIYDAVIPANAVPEDVEAAIHSIPGVLETGFFFKLALKVIIGYEDGTTKVME
jgi:ribose 5-phosphate isomerase A